MVHNMYMKEGNLIVPWKPVDEKQLKKDERATEMSASLPSVQTHRNQTQMITEWIG